MVDKTLWAAAVVCDDSIDPKNNPKNYAKWRLFMEKNNSCPICKDYHYPSLSGHCWVPNESAEHRALRTSIQPIVIENSLEPGRLLIRIPCYSEIHNTTLERTYYINKYDRETQEALHGFFQNRLAKESIQQLIQERDSLKEELAKLKKGGLC